MEKLKKILDGFVNHYVLTFIVVNLISILFLIIQFKFRIGGFFGFLFSAVFCLIPVIIYFSFNHLIEDEDDRDKAADQFMGACVLPVLIMMNAVFFTAFPATDKRWPLAVAGVIDFFVFICLTFAINQPLTKVNLENVKNINLPAKLGLSIFSAKKKPGDVVICKNVETNQDVIIPLKDRFLHMLCLGPTGSGKTSQIIIPMLNQDLRNKEIGVTVIEPKGDLAEKAYAMAQYYGRPAVYFNPISESCPTFNPLHGKEEDVIENMVTAFNMLNPDSQQYFKDMNEQLLRNALKVLKRLEAQKVPGYEAANMINLSLLVSNSMGQGRRMVVEFNKAASKNATEAIKKENDDVANYFLGDYFNEKSKTYENTSGVRSQIAKIVSNKFLRKVLNPPNGVSDINFDKHLEEGTVICISTAQGKLRDLGKYLGFFIILNFQSSVFKRPGRENDRRPHMLYIDEFQTYANPGFADMLTQGRSYRVASHLATQNRALIGMGSGRDGDDFIELVSTNARNVVLFPGGNFMDAKYYSDQFGEITERKFQVGVSRTKFNPIYFEGGKAPSQTERMSEELVPRYTPTDIILKKKKEITYSIIVDGVLRPAGVGKVEYIDVALNKRLDEMIEENDIMMAVGLNPNKWRNLDNGAELKKNLNWKLVLQDYEELERKSRYDYVDEADVTIDPVVGQESVDRQNDTGNPVASVPNVNYMDIDTPPNKSGKPPVDISDFDDETDDKPADAPKSNLPDRVQIKQDFDTKNNVDNDDGEDDLL